MREAVETNVKTLCEHLQEKKCFLLFVSMVYAFKNFGTSYNILSAISQYTAIEMACSLFIAFNLCQKSLWTILEGLEHKK